MSKYWSSVIKEIKPYVPGEQPKDREFIKLNTNENPYPPSPKAITAIKQAATESLRLYPDPNCDELKCTIAQYYSLKEEQVFIGNGSDELLAFAFLAFFNPDSPILFPDITYSFYKVYAGLFQLDYRLIPLDETFSLDTQLLCKKNGGIIIPNPNAPTGKYLSLESIKFILKNNLDVIVIVDEAYIDFGGESAVGLIKDYPNLLIIQTFSKSRSLAGLRVGFALGHVDLIEGLNRVKNSINSYTLDRIALAGATEAIRDQEYFQETRLRIINTRERVSMKLEELGFQITPSKANFIFITHPNYPANTLFDNLREKGVLVRYFNQSRIDNYLRVTIGSDEEMDQFLAIVRGILA